MKRIVVVLIVALGIRAWAQPTPAPTPAPADDTSGDTSGSGSAVAPTGGAGGVQWQGRPIERIQFRGNRKVEDDAIRVQLLSKAGTVLDPTKLREDLRTMWKMGFFADINVEGEVNTNGSLTLTFAVKEKPSIRKVLVAGNNELELSKINEVIDLELDSIVDISRSRRTARRSPTSTSRRATTSRPSTGK